MISLPPRRRPRIVMSRRCCIAPPSAHAAAAAAVGVGRRVRAEPREAARLRPASTGKVARVKAILGLDELPSPHHAADALAVAICHATAPPLLRVASGRTRTVRP